MPKVEDSSKYLGIPTIWGRSKWITVQYIKDQELIRTLGYTGSIGRIWGGQRRREGRYFPNVSFLEAKKSCRASWAWASLLDGQDVILRGAGWQIIGGQHVRYWLDNWIPGLTEGHPILPMIGDANNDCRVAELIDSVTREWNLDLLADLVPETVCGAISRIHTIDGVKADYPDIIMTARLLPEVLTPGFGVARHHKKCDTSFGRRYAATKLNLFRSRWSESPICPICAENDESTEHVLLLCQWATKVWSGNPLRLQINRSPITTLSDWLCLVVSQFLDCKENFERFLAQVTFSCWFIWKSRCEAVFNGISHSPFRTLRSIATVLGTFQKASNTQSLMATTSTGLSRAMLRPSLWSPPPVNWIKLNVDACWMRDSLWGQVRVVVRDWNFGCIAVKCVQVHASKAMMAETLAVLEGCLLARNLQVQEVVIESDA
ncbi:hypothetical protein ACFX14_020050 [Malus domestica]